MSASICQKRRGHWTLKEFGVLCLNQAVHRVRNRLSGQMLLIGRLRNLLHGQFLLILIYGINCKGNSLLQQQLSRVSQICTRRTRHRGCHPAAVVDDAYHSRERIIYGAQQKRTGARMIPGADDYHTPGRVPGGIQLQQCCSRTYWYAFPPRSVRRPTAQRLSSRQIVRVSLLPAVPCSAVFGTPGNNRYSIGMIDFYVYEIRKRTCRMLTPDSRQVVTAVVVRACSL